MEPDRRAAQDAAIEAARAQFCRSEPHITFEKAQPQPQRPASLLPNGLFSGGLPGGLSGDKDVILLLGLVLLLMADGGDRLLILALVYIMS